MTRILLEPAMEDLRATSTISQKLAEGARRASEMRKGLLTLLDCVKGFESVFAKEDFDILPEHRQWDHAIELIPGSEPKSSKVYPLSPVEQKELDSFLEENLRTGDGDQREFDLKTRVTTNGNNKTPRCFTVVH